MRYRISILLLLMIIGLCSKAQPTLSKMSPLVRQAMIPVSRMRCLQGRGGVICAFIKFDGEDGKKAMSYNGVQIIDCQGDIAIASIPRYALSALASCQSIKRIEANNSCFLAMDTVATIINALPVYAGTNLPQAYTGRGVVVGVMDVGFDLTHPNFYDATTQHYRIKAFWDQISKDTIGSSLFVGRDYTDQTSILSVAHSVDGYIQTHGTHTLGIAAGCGYQSAYRGMSPESDICLVSNAVSDDISLIDSADIYKYTSATDALGFKYIFDYAEAHGQPCVASFSEGYRLEYDDEDLLYSQYLERITGPGRIIVASAGNESVHRCYIAKPFGVSAVGSFLYVNAKSANVLVSGKGDYNVRLLSYRANQVDTLFLPLSHCPIDSTQTFPFTTVSGEPLMTVTVGRRLSSFDSERTVCDISFSADTLLNVITNLAFTLEGAEAEADARLHTSSSVFINRDSLGGWNAAEYSHNTLAPGCFPSVVTVGSTIHRTGFTNIDGQYLDYSQVGRNDGVRSLYSSIGPATDGTYKPDIMAPGDNIISSLSSYHLEDNLSKSERLSLISCFDFQGRTYGWNSNSGTSMAAPVVAGAIALWLEACPTLTPNDIKQVFSRTARKPDDSITYPNNYYGYGEIDVYRGLLDILGLSDIQGLSKTQPISVSFGVQASKHLLLSFNKIPLFPIKVSLYNLAGHKVYSREIKEVSSILHYDIDLTSLQTGVYAIQLTSDDTLVTGSSLIRLH